MNKSSNLFRNVLRILGTIAGILYLLFLIAEAVPFFNGAAFADTSVYLLFLVFGLGYYFLWKNELISGLILMVWHGLQWILVFWVWVDGALTLILGVPIGLLGVIVFIYGLRRKSASRTNL